MKEKHGIIQEFKEFIVRGNVMDLAIGIIMGSAFTAIVSSLVNDILMPALGLILGRVNIEAYKIVLTPASGDVAESAIYYGRFFQRAVDFLLIALVVFLMVKGMNRFRRKKETPPARPAEPPKRSEEVLLLEEIRDLLKK